MHYIDYQRMQAGAEALRWLQGQTGEVPEHNPAVITERGPLSAAREAEFRRALRRERIEQIRAKQRTARTSTPARLSGGSQPTRGTRSRIEATYGGPGLNRRSTRGAADLPFDPAARVAAIRSMGGDAKQCGHPGCRVITSNTEGPADVYCADHG